MTRLLRDGRAVILVVLAFVLGPHAVAATNFEDIIKVVREVPGCTPIEGDHGYSFQAKIMYAQDLVGKPIDKRSISFQCKNEMGTVYLYKYSGELELYDAQGSAKQLIWGEQSPSFHHPESIFLFDEILVVVSTHRPKTITNAIQTSRKQEPGKGE